MYKTIHEKIPAGLRRILLRNEFVRRIWMIVNTLILNVWVITGQEILSKQELAIIYIGSEEHKNFLAKLAFGNSYKENYIGITCLWRIFKTVKTHGHFCSLMVAQVPKSTVILFGKKKCFYIPLWVEGEVDISVDIPRLINNESLKSDIRRIKRSKLHFELTHELSQFHNFYYNMYLPYITKAHGNTAIIMKYDSMKKEFKKCDLLFIKKEKEYIAGVLITYTKNVARLWSLGVKDGNLEYIKDGAVGAIFYFSFLHLKEKGFRRVNVGGSRPFYNDGILWYKKKWSQKIVGKHQIGFLIKPLSMTVGIMGFFLNNPFIFVHKNLFNGALFAEAGRSFSREDFQKFYKNYYLTGISKLFIYQFEQVPCGRRQAVPPELSDKITICSADSLF